MLLERRRREDSLLECECLPVISKAKSICFYTLHSILFLVISLMWMTVPIVYMASLLDHEHLSIAFVHSYRHIVFSKHLSMLCIGLLYCWSSNDLVHCGLPYNSLVIMGTVMLINVGLTRAIYLKSARVPLRAVKYAKEVKCSLISFSQACTVLCLLSKLAVCCSWLKLFTTENAYIRYQCHCPSH